MKPENLIKEFCDLSFNKPYKSNKATNDLADILDEVKKLLPGDILIDLDNLISLCNARNLEDGYIQGFKDGANLMMYLMSDKKEVEQGKCEYCNKNKGIEVNIIGRSSKSTTPKDN